MKDVQLNINHSATLKLRSGLQHREFPTRIRQIDGETIEVLSPMEGGRPLPVPHGRKVIIQPQSMGNPPQNYATLVLNQYWAENEGEWVLVLSEPLD
jgi:hypothetical protein